MTSLIAKFVAKRIFAENKENKQGQEDPYFETVPATRLGIKTTRKRKRALPPGLTTQEENVLTKAKRRAYRLDLALFSLCGIRFGWSSVIGIIPAIGDVADMLLALMVFRTICSVEPPLPAAVKMKMQINIAIDFFIGLVPFIGDIADAAYKCNTKNVVLLEEELRKRGQKRIHGTPLANQPDPSMLDIDEEYDDVHHEVRDTRHAASGQPSRHASRRDDRQPRRQRDREYDEEAAIAAPQPARTRSHHR